MKSYSKVDLAISTSCDIFSNNLRPTYVQYGKDYFHNFKDFADIKDKNTEENYY